MKRRAKYIPLDFQKRMKNISIDSFSSDSLQAIRKKLSRDYLGFFQGLRKIYKIGEIEHEVVAAIKLTVVTINLIDTISRTKGVEKQDVEDVVANIEVLNNQRDYFVRTSKDISPLRDRISKVQEETGISPESLNVTNEIVRGGVAGMRKQTREGVLPFLSRTAPELVGAVKGVAGGAAAAVLGPFAPMAIGAAKGIAGISRGLAEKVRARRELSFQRRLEPVATGLSPWELEQGVMARRRGPKVTEFGGFAQRKPSKEELVAPLTYFFDRKADKAKWTKDVLKRLSDKKGETKEGLFGGMLSSLTAPLTKMSSMLGTWLPKLGIIAGLGAGAVIAGKKVTEAVGAAKGLEEARAGRREAAKGLKGSSEQWISWVKEVGVEEASKKTGKSSGQLAVQLANMKQRQEFEERAGRAWYHRGIVGKVLGKKQKELTPYSEILAGVKSGMGIPLVSETSAEVKSSISALPAAKGGTATKVELATENIEDNVRKAIELMPTKIMPEIGDQISKLSSSIDNLSNQVNRGTAAEVKGPGLGDPNDSADALLNAHASGNLSLGSD